MNESIAAISLGGGRKENFFFSLIEYFENEKRWFLTTIKQVKDEEKLDQDEAITSWITNYKLKEIVVDFPLSRPHCLSCDLSCPGTKNCHHPDVVSVREDINSLIEADAGRQSANPKRYEQERIAENMANKFSKNPMNSVTSHHLLSRAFKRKLKKGYLPYWNRPIDYWIWKHYYDQILDIFNISFDSFGSTSVMLIHRFEYLLKHLPKNLTLYESSTYITLLELYRGEVILKKHLMELQDITLAPLARIQIAKLIDKKLGVFIYEKELALIAKNPKAFDSFILAISGMCSKISEKKKLINLKGSDKSFLIPNF